MNGYATKITGAQPIGSQQECDRIGAHNTMRCAFHVRKIKRESSKLADVLGRLQVDEVKPSVAVCRELANRSERKTSSSVKSKVAAIQLHGKSGVHGDSDFYLSGDTRIRDS